MSDSLVLFASVALVGFIIVVGIGLVYIGNAILRMNPKIALVEEVVVKPEPQSPEMQASELPQVVLVEEQVAVPPPAQQALPAEVLFDEYGNPVQAVTYIVPTPQSVPAPQVVVVPQPVVVPIVQQAPPTNVDVQPVPPPIAEAPQALIQRAPILDVQNPVVQLTDAQANASVAPVTSADLSRLGSEVQSEASLPESSFPAGRVKRDKRYRRNASN